MVFWHWCVYLEKTILKNKVSSKLTKYIFNLYIYIQLFNNLICILGIIDYNFMILRKGIHRLFELKEKESSQSDNKLPTIKH